MQKGPQAKKPIFLGLESVTSENQIQYFEIFEKYIKYAPKKTVQNGSYTFPNGLTRFQNNEKPIWVEIQKHCKMQSQSTWYPTFTIKNNFIWHFLKMDMGVLN